MKTERNHEIARGVHISKDPYDMTREELEDTIHNVSHFASQKLYESITLRRIIENLNK